MATLTSADNNNKTAEEHPGSSSEDTGTIDVTINLADLGTNQPKSILHTAVTLVDGKEVKIIIDPGSNATVVTKNCIKKLGLSPKTSSKILNVRTLTGKTSNSSSSVEINFDNDNNVGIHAYVLNSNLTLAPAKINLTKVWPTLDRKLAKAVKDNITEGKIDIVIGVDQLYGKISNTKTIPHPEKASP